ncbi:MAG: phosphatidate cytidylyltransferase [Hyphomicrobiales bacterium]|nr:MAG: phosphatidate cytidylyltransferase [Hyphomicrobiales bacterium]
MSAGSDTAAAKSRELRLRIASAVVLAPIVLGLTWYGGTPYAAMILVGAVLVLYEWVGITGRSKLPIVDWAGGAVVTAAMVATYLARPDIAVVLVLAGALAALLWSAVDRQGRWLALGIAYAGFSGIGMLMLRGGDYGLVAIIFLFAVTWATDIAAYFVGRAVGGPKLWPAVSPKKTWSGAIGGLTGGVIAGIATVLVAGFPVAVGLVLATALISASGQLGDLGESAIKRRFGKKDSSNLIPGHGGIMDRVDALVVGAAVASVIGAARAGWNDPAAGLFIW